jgi:uncharacterized membrane protein
MGYLYVTTTIVLTVYGQVTMKWQMDKAGDLPASAGAKLEFLLRLFAHPWVISAWLAAAIAALAWMAALTHFDLNRVYPFMALSFVFVLLLSAMVLGESVTLPKVAGIVLIFAGLAIGSQT